MSRVQKIIILGIIIGLIYFLYLGLNAIAALIPWYFSLIFSGVGALMYFVGKHFLKKENVLKKRENLIILSTPIQADLTVILGTIIVILSIITSRWFLSVFEEKGIEAFVMKCFTIIMLLAGIAFIVLNIFRLRYALHDRIEISSEEFRFDNAMGKDYDIYRKVELKEIQFLKVFTDNRTFIERTTDTAPYRENEYQFSLTIIFAQKENNDELISTNLDPRDMNIDILLFVEALEMMNYPIIRRSKYDNHEQLWEGHNFLDGHYSKA